MATRPLARQRSQVRRHAGSSVLEALARTPVPPFQLAFPAPSGHGVKHPLYEMRQAANRVYQSRRAAYRAKALELEAAELLTFVRTDVLARLLEEDESRIGPFRFARYRWLDAGKFWAWFPGHRERAETAYAEFRRKLLKRLPGLDLGRY